MTTPDPAETPPLDDATAALPSALHDEPTDPDAVGDFTSSAVDVTLVPTEEDGDVVDTVVVEVHRSAQSGEFVTEEYAEEHPDVTVTEHVHVHRDPAEETP